MICEGKPLLVILSNKEKKITFSFDEPIDISFTRDGKKIGGYGTCRIISVSAESMVDKFCQLGMIGHKITLNFENP